MKQFDQREKELEALSLGKLTYCEEGDICNINHCHLCNKKSENPCCCSDCVNIAVNNWKIIYYEHLGHIQMNDFDPTCKMCIWTDNK